MVHKVPFIVMPKNISISKNQQRRVFFRGVIHAKTDSFIVQFIQFWKNFNLIVAIQPDTVWFSTLLPLFSPPVNSDVTTLPISRNRLVWTDSL